MSVRVTDWHVRRTSAASDWQFSRLVDLKADSSIVVVIPARDEADTVGGVVGLIAAELMELVDELVVMDSLSTDGTAAQARRAGARVYSVADVRPDLGVRPGKGEALWKSLFVTTADLLERARIGCSGVWLSGVVPELLKGEGLEFGCQFS